jgi:hypothetical protein
MTPTASAPSAIAEHGEASEDMLRGRPLDDRANRRGGLWWLWHMTLLSFRPLPGILIAGRAHSVLKKEPSRDEVSVLFPNSARGSSG